MGVRQWCRRLPRQCSSCSATNAPTLPSLLCTSPCTCAPCAFGSCRLRASSTSSRGSRSCRRCTRSTGFTKLPPGSPSGWLPSIQQVWAHAAMAQGRVLQQPQRASGGVVAQGQEQAQAQALVLAQGQVQVSAQALAVLLRVRLLPVPAVVQESMPWGRRGHLPVQRLTLPVVGASIDVGVQTIPATGPGMMIAGQPTASTANWTAVLPSRSARCWARCINAMGGGFASASPCCRGILLLCIHIMVHGVKCTIILAIHQQPRHVGSS